MEFPGLAERYAAVQAHVADAARAAGRDPDGITTIVVTKFQPPEMIDALLELGVADFGESRHPEARDKAVLHPEAKWHFIGQLQTNKARAVRRYADVLHSLDRPALVDALAPVAEGLSVFIQVNLDDAPEPGRGGVSPADATALAERVLEAGGFRLEGVMGVAPRDADPTRAFERLRETRDAVQALTPSARGMSAGMSNDFAAAVAAGATHLRIGSAITGARPQQP